MKISLWRCDRCEKEERGFSGINMRVMQIPDGHVSRLDVMSNAEPRELCKECAESFNQWWLAKRKAT